MIDFIKFHWYWLRHKLGIVKNPFIVANPNVKYFTWLKIEKDWKKSESTYEGMVVKYNLNKP